MTDIENVLGGGSTAAPKYHDFMQGVSLDLIEDDAGVENMIVQLEARLNKHTKLDPVLMSVDVETTAVRSLLQRYEDIAAGYNTVRRSSMLSQRLPS